MRTKMLVGAAVVACTAMLPIIAATPAAAGAARSASPNTISTTSPCGSLATSTPPATFAHVVWILYENKTRSAVMTSPQAPYIQSIAHKCGEATNWNDLSTTSLANYIAMTSGSLGSSGEITSNRSPKVWPQSQVSVFEQLGTAGRQLNESMPSNCYLKGSGDFEVDHAPMQYYTRIRTTLCPTQSVPLNLSAPDLSGKLTVIIPNKVDDMHKSPQTPTLADRIAAGDQWTSKFLPTVLASPQYQAGNTVVILTWDEAIGKAHNVPFVVISPYTAAGTTSSKFYNHYSLLRTTQNMLGITQYLGHAADSTTGNFRTDFHLG